MSLNYIKAGWNLFLFIPAFFWFVFPLKNHKMHTFQSIAVKGSFFCYFFLFTVLFKSVFAKVICHGWNYDILLGNLRWGIKSRMNEEEPLVKPRKTILKTDLKLCSNSHLLFQEKWNNAVLIFSYSCLWPLWKS